jgi:hypothetical protein
VRQVWYDGGRREREDEKLHVKEDVWELLVLLTVIL